jgi:putative FmdB family regulatory protein
MPLYEYECAKCGERFEVIAKFSDAPLAKHEGCGGKVKRLLSAPAIQFKGSGWYVTDYARSGKADASSDKKADKKAEADAKSKASSESKGESDSKPKAESKESSKSETKSSDPAKTPAKTDSSKK